MKVFLYLMLVFSFVCGMNRQELRLRYKDDQHQWIAPIQSNRCSICLQPDGWLTSLGCHKTHQFHSACIEEWRAQKSECPICRVPIEDSIICTCLKSLAKPGVLILLAAVSVSALQTLQKCDTVDELFSAPCKTQCDVCMQLSTTALCAFYFGCRLYYINHPKND